MRNFKFQSSVSSYRTWLFCGSILIIAGFALLWERYRLVPYTPVVLIVDRGNHILRYDASLLDSELKKNISFVLTEYGEYHQEQKGAVLIRNHLFRDMDTLQNYTDKAEALRENHRDSAKSFPD